MIKIQKDGMTKGVVLSFIAIAMILSHFSVSADKVLKKHIYRMKDIKKIVNIHQVSWEVAKFRGTTYDWGEISIDRKELFDSFEKHGRDITKTVFVNVWLKEPNLWLVENLRVPAIKCGTDSFDNLHHMRHYFKLVDVAEQINQIDLITVMSHHKLPVTQEVTNHVYKKADKKGYLKSFPVKQVKENTDGLSEEDGDKAVKTVTSFGPPPQPVDYVARSKACLDCDWSHDFEILQDATINLQSAVNQCVIVAISNSLGFLQETSHYPWGGHTFEVQDELTKGYGQFNSATWTAVPANSLVAWVDYYASRAGTTTYNTGSGSQICDLFDGLFLYTKNRMEKGSAKFTHEGAAAIYGLDQQCGKDSYGSDDISVRANPKPTWPWIYDALSTNKAVIINFYRYNDAGAITSGHSIRVWGASRSGIDHYIYTLDDSIQGDINNADTQGLRTQKWVVKDTGNSATGNKPGTSDGMLNMNGLAWEIFMSVSIERVNAPPSF